MIYVNNSWCDYFAIFQSKIHNTNLLKFNIFDDNFRMTLIEGMYKYIVDS